MSMEFYKIMHLTGIFMVMVAFGALISQVKSSKSSDIPDRKMIGITHGIGLLLALVGGFGLMARLSVPWEGWIIAKMVFWLVLGGLSVLIKKKPSAGNIWWALVILIGACAVYLVRTRPF